MKETTKIIYLFFFGVVAYLMAYFFNAFISHNLTPAGYGDFSVAFKTIFILSLILLLGTNVSSVKYLSTFFNSNNKNEVIHFVKWNIRIIVKTSLLCFVIFILIYILMWILHIYNIREFTSYHFFIYVIWMAPFSAIYILLASIILSDKKTLLSFFISKILLNIILTFILFTAVFFFEVSINFLLLLIILFVAFCLIIIGELIIVVKIFKRSSVKLTANTEPLDKPEQKVWMSDSLKLSAGHIIFTFTTVIDLFIIEWIHPDENATGYYATMIVIVAILWFVPSSITSYLAPRLTPLLQSKNYNVLQKLIDKVNLINIPVIAIISSLIIIFSHYLLSLFGKEYTVAQIPLIVLTVAYFLFAISMSNARVLMFHNSKKVLIFNTTELVILILFSIVLTYYFGILGMSFAVLLANIYNFYVMYVTVKKSLPVKPFSII
ncbi:MAG: oligosaccharide flippase family protein [Bacteroidota bacterium]